jgi:protein-S-isoprenylcysteine O-methyltransferase Ste14
MPIGKLIAGVLLNLVIFGSLLFGPAGTWAWPRAWAFLGVVLVSSVGSIIPLLGSPELLAERFKPPIQQGQPLADKILLLLFLGAFCGLVVCIPLDVFHWHLLGTPGPPGAWLGLVLFVLGWVLITLALRANAFAALVVKHQAERHQTVVDAGPYRIVRHPMYAGFIPFIIGMPLWLGSYLAAVLAIVPIVLVAIRVRIEEAFLRRELPGYAAYLTRVRYRLIPFVW